MKLTVVLPCALVCAVLSCSPKQNGSGSAVGVKTAPPALADNTITDSRGRVIPIPQKVDRVVVLNTDCYNILVLIGAENTVVGVNGGNDEALQKGVQDFGDWRKPNIEKILDARPDAVFAYGTALSGDTAKQIERAGVLLVFLEFYIPSLIPYEIEQLGRFYKKEKEARAYIDFMTRYSDMVTARVSALPPQERVTVYYEGYGDYSSVAKGTGGHELIDMAGCVNLMENAPQPYPKASVEWVLAQNPSLIVKTNGLRNVLGRNVTDPSAARREYEKLCARTGWIELDAVQKNRVIILSADIGASSGSFIGILAIAKKAYPDLFSDIDPASIYDYMRETFFRSGRVDNRVLLYPPF